MDERLDDDCGLNVHLLACKYGSLRMIQRDLAMFRALGQKMKRSDGHRDVWIYEDGQEPLFFNTIWENVRDAMRLVSRKYKRRDSWWKAWRRPTEMFLEIFKKVLECN